MTDDDKLLGLFKKLADEMRVGEDVAEAVRRAEGDPDRHVGSYLLLEALGRGGAGTVYRGWHRELKRLCAIKFLTATGEDDRRRLMREARIAAQLSHPGIVTVHEVGTHKDVPYVVMALVDGPTLEKVRLGPRQALETIRAAAEAIHYAHGRGVLHRDLKPANILLGSDGRPRISDFGLARLEGGGTTVTQSGTIAGTPGFMAPETVESRPPTARTDVYGLGATLYALLAGAPPHDGANVMEVLRRISSTDPQPLRRRDPSIHRDVEVIVQKAMAREPERRYATAQEMADDIGRYLEGRAIEARATSVAYHVRRKLARHWAVALLSMLLLASPGTLLWHVRRGSDRPAQDGRRIGPLLDRAAAILDRAEPLQYSEEGTVAKVRDTAEKALPSLREALAIDAENGTAHALMGRALALMSRPEEALLHYSKALDLFSARLGRGRIYLGWYQEAKLFLRSKKRGDADEWLRRALEDFQKAEGGSGTDLLLARASAAYADRRYDEALALCEQAPADDPAAAELHVLAARAWSAKGQPRRGVEACDRALKLRPGFHGAFEQRGRAWWTVREFEKAIADYTRALRYDESRASAWNMLGLSYYHGPQDLKRARESFDAAIRIDPDLVEPYSNRALVLTTEGDFDAAERDLTAAIERAPDWPELYHNRSAVYQHLKDLSRALADAEEMIRRFPENPLSYASRGRVRGLRGEFAGAREDCETALRLGARCVEALELRALLLLSEERYEEAIEAARKVLEVDPRNGRAYAVRGTAKYKTGDSRGAKDDWREAVRLDPALRRALEPLLKD